MRGGSDRVLVEEVGNRVRHVAPDGVVEDLEDGTDDDCVADDEESLLGTVEERSESGRVAFRGLIEALTTGASSLVAASMPVLPLAEVVDRRTVERTDIYVVEVRLHEERDPAAAESDLGGLAGAWEPSAEGDVQLDVP